MFQSFGIPPASSYVPEIVTFLAKTGELMLDVTIRPYIVTSVCHNMFSDDPAICSSANSMKKVENDVQNSAAKFLLYYRILTTVPAVIVSLACGAWSDKHGRKIPMVFSSIGTIFAVVVYLMGLQFSKLALSFIMVGALIQGVFGKRAVVGMAVNSYISDVTKPDERTQRFGRVIAMLFLGKFMGSLLAGVLQQMVSFGFTLCVVSAVNVLGVLLVLFGLSEGIPENLSEMETEFKRIPNETSEEETELETESKKIPEEVAEMEKKPKKDFEDDLKDSKTNCDVDNKTSDGDSTLDSSNNFKTNYGSNSEMEFNRDSASKTDSNMGFKTNKNEPDSKSNSETTSKTNSNTNSNDSTTDPKSCSKAKSKFDCGLTEFLKILFKPRKGNSRSILIVLFVCINLYQMAYSCNEDITVMFVKRSPLSWPESWYGYLMAAENASMGICLLVFLPLLSNVWKISESAILMISISFNIIRAVWTAFCKETWMMFATVIIGGMAGTVLSVVRSSISKHVGEDELGKIFSLVSSTEIGSKLIGSIMFTNMYASTVYFFPGFSFLFQGCLCLIVFLMTVWLYRQKCYKEVDGTKEVLVKMKDYETSKGEKESSVSKDVNKVTK